MREDHGFNLILTPVSTTLENHPVPSMWGILCRHMLHSRLLLSLKQRGCNAIWVCPPSPLADFSLLLAATSAQFPRRYVQLSFRGGKQAFRAAARRALAPAAPPGRPALPTSLALCLSLEARRISQASSQPESQGSRVKGSQAQHTAPPAQRREGKRTVQAAPGLARSPTDGGGS